MICHVGRSDSGGAGSGGHTDRCAALQSVCRLLRALPQQICQLIPGRSHPKWTPNVSYNWRTVQVGGEAWQEQHDAVVALNLQAHHCASSNADEFVKEALVLHDKLRVLVFDLLAFEVRVGNAVGCWDICGRRDSARQPLLLLPGNSAQQTVFSVAAGNPLIEAQACRLPAAPTADLVAGRNEQVWQARVLPLLWGHLASEVDSVAAYDLLYHEAALVNLLEVRVTQGHGRV